MKKVLIVFAMLGVVACRSSPQTSSSGIVVVNAPADGVVRRVLASEGVAVQAGAPLVEIAVATEGATQTANNTNTGAGVIAEQDARRKSAAAQSEVERTVVEVQRVESLGSSGRAHNHNSTRPRRLPTRAGTFAANAVGSRPAWRAKIMHCPPPRLLRKPSSSRARPPPASCPALL